jgi:hypothetical protein
VRLSCCSRYETFCNEHLQARHDFRRRNWHRRNRRGRYFPDDLAEAQPFPKWLEAEVAREQEEDSVENPSEDVIRLSKLPSLRASRYRSMWAFGNHLQVAHLRTCDSSVAATFLRPCRSGVQDRNPVLASIEYVGNVEEILEVNYGGLFVTVLVCRQVYILDSFSCVVPFTMV